jgi:hypothetical protein
MTLPSILLGLLFSTLFGALFHLWRGGGAGRLILYFVLSLAGFWLGHAAGGSLGWTFAALGPLNLGMAVLGCALFLFAGDWLSRVEVERG